MNTKKLHSRNILKKNTIFQFFGTPDIFQNMENISFGWKLHVAADLNNFYEVLEILELKTAKYPFLLKAFLDPKELEKLQGTVQEGKAFTIYVPQDNLISQVLSFAEKLDSILKNLSPPSFKINEQPFCNSSFIYYRFGEYEPNKTVVNKTLHPLLGIVYTCHDGYNWTRDTHGNKWLIGPNNEIWQDRQEKNYKPPWLEDPFIQ